MTSSTDRPGDTGAPEDEELRQPAQEIVDPREADPEPDAPEVAISGAREPTTDPAADPAGRSEH